MYPDRELIRLAAHKVVLRRNIAARRRECVEAAAGVLEPLAWLDRMLALWKKFAPFAAVPLGFLVTRAVAPRLKILRSVMRWGPLVVGAVRGIRSIFKSGFGAEKSSQRSE